MIRLGNQYPSRSSRGRPRAPAIFPALAAVAFVAFLLLAVVVHGHRGPFGLDTEAANLTAGPSSGWFHVGAFVTFFGSPVAVAVMAVAVAGFVWWRYRERVVTPMVPLSAALGGLLNNLAKVIVRRPRPPTAIFTHASGFGFPSGHTVGFTSFAVAVAGLVVVLQATRLKRIMASVIAFVASVAIALSRVVVGAHWLTDVIGGLLLGAAIGLAVIVLAMRLRRRNELRLADTAAPH